MPLVRTVRNFESARGPACKLRSCPNSCPLNTPEGREADAILRACVHCGFCTATCPTYQLLGDELDGPRGRIYQIKLVLEGQTPTRVTQRHLDRCLTCRACETTCPSGCVMRVWPTSGGIWSRNG
jgi:succinate dehydrogenase/fumarate reductase-like Fe-S protein